MVALRSVLVPTQDGGSPWLARMRLSLCEHYSKDEDPGTALVGQKGIDRDGLLPEAM